MSYHEAPDPRTDKAPRHQQAASIDTIKVSNAEIVNRKKQFDPNKIKFSLDVPSGYQLVWMTPQEYIDRVNVRNKMSDDEIAIKDAKALTAYGKGILYHPPFSNQKINALKEAMKNGAEIDMPMIEYRDGKMSEQEGFHRALIARKLGINYSSDRHYVEHGRMIPVAIKGEMPERYKMSKMQPEDQIPDILNI